MSMMNTEVSQLSWDQLQQTRGEIPWPALYAFADAVVTDSSLIPKFFEVYDRAYQEALDKPTRADFYVAAIFALAASRLDEERRRQIGEFLVKKLVQAGQDDADVSLEILQAAAGAMGPVIVPAVLDAIAHEPDTFGAWFFLWSLTALAAQSEDEALRSRVVQACVDLLEKVERDEADPGDGMNAAWTLAAFQRPEHADRLRRLSEKLSATWWAGDYREALKQLEGRTERTPPPQLWEEPVEEWLTSRCQVVEETAAEEKEVEEEYDLEEDELEKDPSEEYAQLIAMTFMASPVAAGLPPELLNQARLVAHDLVGFSLKFLHKQPREWDEATLRELLLDFVPRDTPADRDQLRKIIPITEAFLYWLGSQGLLAGSDELTATVRTWNDQLVAKGMDRKNWGPVKTYLMDTRAVGADAMNERGVIELFKQQIDEIVEGIRELPEPAPSAPEEPRIPIVEHSRKPARNDPCPCGSGKKYKKCHGRPDAEKMETR
jgi:hypothetical protein